MRKFELTVPQTFLEKQPSNVVDFSKFTHYAAMVNCDIKCKKFALNTFKLTKIY